MGGRQESPESNTESSQTPGRGKIISGRAHFIFILRLPPFPVPFSQQENNQAIHSTPISSYLSQFLFHSWVSSSWNVWDGRQPLLKFSWETAYQEIKISELKSNVGVDDLAYYIGGQINFLSPYHKNIIKQQK